jgi:hypothetical protein
MRDPVLGAKIKQTGAPVETGKEQNYGLGKE